MNLSGTDSLGCVHVTMVSCPFSTVVMLDYAVTSGCRFLMCKLVD
jgi:hypothetical protein